jgi:hypothetical protein
VGDQAMVVGHFRIKAPLPYSVDLRLNEVLKPRAFARHAQRTSHNASENRFQTSAQFSDCAGVSPRHTIL